MTIENLAQRMEEGFKKADQNLNDLALMVARGFEEMATQEDIARLELGQDDIKLRLDQMAPDFEVKNLKKRVNKIENHLGLT